MAILSEIETTGKIRMTRRAVLGGALATAAAAAAEPALFKMEIPTPALRAS